MARTKKNTETGSSTITPNQLMQKFLKDNEKDHYNFEQEHDYVVSSGSLILDYELGGGFGPGLHRFVGFTESGKTSEALQIMKNFLETVPNGRGFYIKAEGRLSKNMQGRSGVNFVFDAEDWQDGNCFVFECNIYETVMDALRKLVGKNDTNNKYCFILDSVDGLISKNDLDKSFEDSKKVAGGAVIASDFMKKVSIALAKRGHMAIFISQVRADIKLDPYSKAPIRQTSATGGNALLHFANWILEFEPSFKSDQILEKPNEKPDREKNKILGRYAKITVKKSPNEKTNNVIPYPILFNRTGGNSIWVEKEILDMMYVFEFANKKGAGWIEFDEDFVNLVQEKGIELPQKIQGENQFSKFLEDNADAKNFLVDYFKKSLSQSDFNSDGV